MPEQTRSYVAIDLKSFYASVECKERNLDPLTTNLVVADPERTTKTICLAVSPALKAYGIPGRARLFEVVRKVKEINGERKRKNEGHEFTGQSCDTGELKADRSFALDYITAVPRMALYMKYSTRIYDIYLKYVAPEDIHVYSIDEVFMDVTDYLHTYRLTPEEAGCGCLLLWGRRPGLRRQLELVRICIWQRLRWISWQSIANRMRMVSGLQVWMR